MYRLNYLQRNVLITPDEVIFHAPTDHTFDARKLLSSIIVAEERFIRPELTYNFYEALAAEKNKLVTPSNKTELTILVNSVPEYDDQGNLIMLELKEGDIVNSVEFLSDANKRLWRQHLWKLVSECVIAAATPNAYVQMSSAGAIHNQPTTNSLSAGAVTPGLPAMKWIIDKNLQDRIGPLIKSMQEFICKARTVLATAYPLYSKLCDCDNNGVPLQKKTNWVTGVYDEEKTNCCNGWDQLSPREY